ncbi:hypothetical protein NCLIV_057840 [Neospora caninum Liverpool]|uniref:Uncharacterized protein n=1 Tax=Neospora caninum (strain Liverpool) TaxID=572307 RepID=F0VNR5_NEOCL|nr:hypothetical protein NCLIV_057840 [Neospora caninum Liverpool]CBZ55361.1 hypothetical protein NCLIV_057840 [Neospora caninum Liverpool]CEL70097.1 TPA: hypothetical protein BN1204_057840 [Neospora caninum Liverpool]|eukprot:XP_003885389.1 hypothetical protein NCLIV_057840 [Neospora caninum Liverpool]
MYTCDLVGFTDRNLAEPGAHFVPVSPILLVLLLSVFALLGLFLRLFPIRPLHGLFGFLTDLLTQEVHRGFDSGHEGTNTDTAMQPDLEMGGGLDDEAAYTGKIIDSPRHDVPEKSAAACAGWMLIKGQEPSTPSESWSTTESAGGVCSEFDDEDDAGESGYLTPRVTDRPSVRPSVVPQVHIRRLKLGCVENVGTSVSSIDTGSYRSFDILGIATY